MEDQNFLQDQKPKGKYVPPPARSANSENKFAKFLSNRTQETFSSNQSGSKETNFEAYEEQVEISDPQQQEIETLNTFEECQVYPQLISNIKRLKYGKPTAVQKNAIPYMLLRRDLIACAQTGSGKTAAYIFPIIAKMLAEGPPKNVETPKGRTGYPVSLILSPTRELSIQIYQEAIKFAADTGIRSVVIYGGSDPKLQSREFERGVDILVATPGRLIDFLQRNKLSLQQVKYIVLDEADRMLDMGFEPQIRNILQNHGIPNAREIMMCSATFPKNIQQLAGEFMTNYVFLSVGRVGSTSDLITQEFQQVDDEDKKTELHSHLQKIDGLVLIFVETKKTCMNLEDFLECQGYSCACIHGDKTQPERIAALNNFKSGKTPILVATDVASRGLDIPSVHNVINYDAPNNIDDYIHRIGRTGRCGKEGVALTFINEKNRPLLRPLFTLLIESNQNIPRWLEVMQSQAMSQQKTSFNKNKKFTDFRQPNSGFFKRNQTSQNNQKDAW